MFSRTKRAAAQASESLPSRPMGAVPSIISADMTIIGDIASQGEVHIDGTVQGDVTVKALVLGEGADIKGTISAEKVRVCGAVTGSIRAQDVTLVRTARVLGDILHLQLAIEPGARLEGMCRRLDGEMEPVEGEILEPERPPPDMKSIFHVNGD